jgi:hypothetical protein
MRALMLLLVLANAGCLRKTEFQCADDGACGTSGRCESSGFCSFADPDCSSGRRYDQSAGTLANQCTSGGMTGDGGPIDTPPNNNDATMMIDAPPAGCPTGYNAIVGGQANHLYKLVTAADDWAKQQTGCRMTSASSNLAIPDDITEHTAIDTLAGAGNYWVGISDTVTEGTFLTVLGAVPSHLPWQLPAPDNGGGVGGGEDCVESLPAVHMFNDRRCMDNLPTVCECVPP